MSNGITANTDKKLFDRWKENFKEFFIEDEHRNGTKSDEEKENLIEEETVIQKEPIDQVIEMAEEKMKGHPKSLVLNGNRKEDLEGIPEVENEESHEQILDENGETENMEKGKDENEHIEDKNEDAQNVGDIDADEEASLIKETVEESTNDNQQAKTPFSKILEKFPFIRKKTEILVERQQENHDQVEESAEKEATNGLPSYHEAVYQEDEGENHEVNGDESINREEISNAEEDTEVGNSKIVLNEEISTMQEFDKEDEAQEEKVETNIKEEETENYAEDKVVDMPKQEEKKFRFKFQFFTDRK